MKGKTMSEIYFIGPDGMFEPISHIGMYSDSTPMVKTAGWSRIVDRANTLTVTSGSLATFTTAMFLLDAVEASGGMIETLVLPYVPGARQDRVNASGDVLFTAASVAEMINNRGMNKVVVLDPHSPVITSLIKRVEVFPQSEVAKMLPSGYDGVIAADKGGKDRAEQMAKALDVPVFYGGKTRDVSTGKLTGFTLDPLPKGHFLVVDDICDGGGTFAGLAGQLKRRRTADLYVSHGIFSKGTGQLKEHYSTVFTTDSLTQNDRNGVTILPVVKMMEDYNG